MLSCHHDSKDKDLTEDPYFGREDIKDPEDQLDLQAVCGAHRKVGVPRHFRNFLLLAPLLRPRYTFGELNII